MRAMFANEQLSAPSKACTLLRGPSTLDTSVTSGEASVASSYRLHTGAVVARYPHENGTSDDNQGRTTLPLKSRAQKMGTVFALDR